MCGAYTTFLIDVFGEKFGDIETKNSEYASKKQEFMLGVEQQRRQLKSAGEQLKIQRPRTSDGKR